MKKRLKTILIIIGFIIGIILLDTLQAIIFKNSPALSLREFLEDNDSYVDRGILIDTYYCTKDKDIVTVSLHTKNSKFTCPIDNKDELNEAKGVSMYIKEGTLTNTSATIIIKDMSGKNNIYGEEYRIDKLVDGNWQELEVVVEGNYGWNSIGYRVDDDNILELDINWQWLYGELTPGTYRLVKSTSAKKEIKKYYFSVEFEINNNYSTKNFTLNLTKKDNCTNTVKEYYTSQDRTVYFVCLDEIYLKRKNTKDMTLKYHLENVNQSFETSINEIVSDMNIINYLYDGGTKIYKNDEYTVITCNTLDGNKDIYFGDNNLEYHQEYCK